MALKVFSKLNYSMFLYTQIDAHAHMQNLVHSFRKQITNWKAEFFLYSHKEGQEQILQYNFC